MLQIDYNAGHGPSKKQKGRQLFGRRPFIFNSCLRLYMK